MITNPFLPSPSAASAWAEGFTKGFAATSSPEPGENVSADDIDAFNQGVATGEECVRTGLSLENPCIAALEEEHLEAVHTVITNLEAAHVAVGFATKIAEGFAGLAVMLIELACTLPVHTLPPDEVLDNLGQPIVETLVSYGIESMELFCGAGVDAGATDCEIRLTPFFTTFDQAHQAAIEMNRFQWVVASWRTDQSNSFEIVASG